MPIYYIHFIEGFFFQLKWLNVYHQTIRDQISPHIDANTVAWLSQQTEPISKQTEPVPPAEL